MERNRILELALEELKRRKAGIDADIEEIQAELTGTGTAIQQTPSHPSAGTGKQRQRTPAERRKQSLRMKKYWAAKRAQAEKPAAPAKTAPAAASTKTRSLTAAQKKTLSLKMKAAWKKRKAGEARKSQPQ
jgi:hypothetical protein